MQNKDNLEKRKKDLENYLKQLISCKEWKNSRKVIKFLMLQDFFADLIESCPDPLYSGKDKAGFVV